MNLNLNPESARAGSGGSNRIDSKGKYKGVINHAKYHTVPTGSQWVEFSFTSDAGQEARIGICIVSKDGNETYGMKKLQAVMACCNIRELTTRPALIKEYDYDLKAMIDVNRDVFNELSGAKIGLALFRDDKTSKKGKDFFSMELEAPFNYQSEQTAQEILDKMPAQSLEKIVQRLKDKDSRRQNQTNQQSYTTSDFNSAAQACGSFDDDIPF